MQVKKIVEMLRLPFLTATLIPVLLGAVISWYGHQGLNILNLFLSVAGISFLHIGTNIANDYFDHKSLNDWVNRTPTPFSGGSRVIQKGIAPVFVLSTAIIFFVLGSLTGLYINYRMGTNIVLFMGIIGVFCGFFYTAPPVRLGYIGLGEIVVGLCFGPLVLLGSYYTHAGSFSFLAVLVSVPVAVLIFQVLFINEFPDYEADRQAGKKTLVVLMGKKKAIRLYHMLISGVYVYTAFCIATGIFPIFTAAVFLTVPLAIKAYSVSAAHYMDIEKLLPANALTIALHMLFGVLLGAGFLLERII